MKEYAKINVVSIPVEIQFDCPLCKEGVKIGYKEFCSDMGEACDWDNSDFECPKCEKSFIIDGVDWVYWD
jgi:hypothetical protein